MANKRMFTMKIVDSDAFLDMPASSQNLYFHLCMRADDDGFVGNPKKISKMIGASEDDLKLLIAKRFVLTFENGVIVIKHWRMHNTLSSGRYHETQYLDEKRMLRLKDNNSYSLESGRPIDDSKLIEMYAENKRRTNGEQVENADIDTDIDTDKESDKGKDKGLMDINNNIAPSYAKKTHNSEPFADVSALILNDGSEWLPLQCDFEEYERLYPAVDVRQQFNEMRAWCINNPKKRKTKSGIKRFVGNWLSGEQNKGGNNAPYSARSTGTYIDKISNRVAEVDKWV